MPAPDDKPADPPKGDAERGGGAARRAQASRDLDALIAAARARHGLSVVGGKAHAPAPDATPRPPAQPQPARPAPPPAEEDEFADDEWDAPTYDQEPPVIRWADAALGARPAAAVPPPDGTEGPRGASSRPGRPDPEPPAPPRVPPPAEPPRDAPNVAAAAPVRAEPPPRAAPSAWDEPPAWVAAPPATPTRPAAPTPAAPAREARAAPASPTPSSAPPPAPPQDRAPSGTPADADDAPLAEASASRAAPPPAPPAKPVLAAPRDARDARVAPARREARPAPRTDPAPGPGADPRPEARAVPKPDLRPAEAPSRGRGGRARAPGSQAIRRGWRAFLTLAVFAGLGAAVALVATWAVLRDVPLARMLPPQGGPSLEVVTSDGRTLTSRGPVRAPFVPLPAMPPHLVEAVLAVEDRRFREHGGVDGRGLLRALVRNARAGAVVEGGSTVTQQLVKILYLDPEQTWRRKLQEMALATTLERQVGKDRVLELYLNAVYLGSGAYGMPAAARVYFGKEVAELELAEAALLAASIQLPSQVNPLAGLGPAQNRAALVLRLMAEQGRITPEDRDAATVRLAILAPSPPPERAGSYFADWATREAQTVQAAAAESVTATATLDPALQAEAERVIREVMDAEGAAVGATQAALVAMTPDGRVRAMVGGVDYASSQFNRATDALRQPGSAFKLFVYMAAFALGADPDDQVSDAPVSIDGWSPENFDRQSHGTVTLREAFANSYNLATVRLAGEVGTDAVVATARQLGIESELQATPSLALGTSEVTLLDLTEAYAAVALGRAPVRATGLAALRFENGAALSLRGGHAGQQVQLSRTRGPMRAMLEAVVADGTGRAAALPGVEAAGKTGTSQDNRDAWFVGFADGLVVGVWVGNDDNSPMRDVTGGGLPARIWREVVATTVDGAAGAPDREAAAVGAAVGAGAGTGGANPSCNVAACAAAFRSFDPATCTYQPLDGPRRICER